MNPTIQLASGHYFDFTNVKTEDIRIEDIAHALSMLCRFTGHCRDFYSVAQHSYLVSHLVPPADALAGLLHDASEAYINDLSRPLKLLVPSYRTIEHDVIWPKIAERFGLPLELPPCVKEADNIALVSERRDLMPSSRGEKDEWHWARDIPRLDFTIYPLDHRTAKAAFLNRYEQLIREVPKHAA